MTSLNKFSPYFLALLRVVIGYTFLLHGTAKFFEFPISMTGGKGSVELMSQMGLGGVLEIVGGVLFILGLFTRPVAFLLSGMMAVAYFQFHAPSGNVAFPLANKGEPAVLFCFVFLYFVFSGAGVFALDNKVSK
ncbi:hypothetical protein A4G18_01615 [Pasteurellaceae bacterium Pebbles2]|nr:hypothetical protein [Pasteurellaceae bacterium Pebbles2]